MRIGMDLREAESTHPTGKGMWAKHVYEELRARSEQLVPFRGKGGLMWHLRTANEVKKQKPCDIYLAPTSYIVPAILAGQFPNAVVVHDLIAYKPDPHDIKAKLVECVLLPAVVNTATHIFVVSEATKEELLRKFPVTDSNKIATVYAGPTVGESQDEWYESRNILCLGTLCPRKNQLRLINAFEKLPENVQKEHPLVLVGGRGWNDGEIVRRANASPYITWKGYVDKVESLYAQAAVFAYPSLYEGFGIPVLDAMTLGVPVLTSNRSSLQEVAGDAAQLVDPESEEEMTQALHDMLTNEDLRRDMIARGKERAAEFSWSKTVDRIVEALRRSS